MAKENNDILQTKTADPMKLFISYGHPEAKICRDICAALTERGHSVWFDETHIPHGSDWREQITKGILESRSVLSMISRHSVRDPGVCLDEMSIAIGVKQGMVSYVLLEDQKIAEPPASMTTRQWLDMSDWQNHGDDNIWFRNKMRELIRMIESPENREFNGQIAELRQKLPMLHVSTAKQESLLRKPFIGREWIRDKVDTWLNDPEGDRICFLFGDPGIGKSAFAAHYTHYNGRVAAAVFCESNNPQFNDPRAVIQTLAFLMACRLPDYRLLLLDALDKTKEIGIYNELELFDLLLAHPLNAGSIDGHRETMCILIDGLDESGDTDRNALTEVLMRYSDRLPRWLRILALSRRVDAVTEAAGSACHIDLMGRLEENSRDIRKFFEEEIQEKYGSAEGYSEFVDSLAERSGGIFLYAALMADAIRKGKIGMSDTDHIPDGLDSAFFSWFSWIFPDRKEYEELFQCPLECIAASPEPLPEEELKVVFGWNNKGVNRFVRKLEVLLRHGTNDFGKKTLQLNHKYIAEWLSSRAAGSYQVDCDDARQEMGKIFLDRFKEIPDELTQYEIFYLAEFIELSDRKSFRTEIGNMDYLWKLLYAGDEARIWSHYDTALRFYKRAEEYAVLQSGYIHRNLGKRHIVNTNRIEGELWGRIGRIYQEISSYDEALEMYTKELELNESLILDNQKNLCLSYINVAGIYEKQGYIEEAVELCKKALEICEKFVSRLDTSEDLEKLSASYYKVAGIYYRQSDYEKALELFKKELELTKKLVLVRGTLDDQKLLSSNYSNIALIYEMQNKDKDALELYNKSLSIFKKVKSERGTPNDYRNLSISYYNLAVMYEKQGNCEEAFELYNEALQTCERLVSERGTLDDQVLLAEYCTKIALIYEMQNKDKDAIELYDRSLYFFEKVTLERGTPDDYRNLSISYNNAAGIYEKQGRYEEALELYNKELEINKKIYEYC